MSNWPELIIPSPDQRTAELAETLNTSPVLAQLLINRQIDIDEARWMLDPDPPMDWPMPAFSTELQALFHKHQSHRIAIFGDYDADGLSGTSVLSTFLRGAGFEVTPVLPTRSQGYGLNTQTLTRLAHDHHLLITVDCGISNAAEIAEAQQLGLDVIVTDHHGLPETLPSAAFILHPAVLEIPELANLSGAGMAYWLTILLAPAFPDAPAPESLLDLAVLGTLADMTPLRGLNFGLAKQGLRAMRQTQRPGLIALAELKNVDLKTLTEDDLTFRMIPMLNAAGRIDSPQPALDLLLADSAATAQQLALTLQDMNTLRQEYCKDVLDDILQRLSDEPPEAVIVLADAKWPHGVLGITCSQLVERFHKPVALLAIDGELAKASIRSPKGYHVLEALQVCDALLVRYGGHEMAGGLTVRTADLPAFKEAFSAACVAQQTHFKPSLRVEMEVNPQQLDLHVWESMRQLAPFGMGNPAPLFLSLNVDLKDLHPDRKSGTHLFGELSNRTRFKGWQMWDEQLKQQSCFDMIYQLEQQSWRGRTKLELTLKKIRPHRSAAASKKAVPASPRQSEPLSAAATVTVPLPTATNQGPVKSKPVRPAPLPERACRGPAQWLDYRQRAALDFAHAVHYSTDLASQLDARGSHWQSLLLDQPASAADLALFEVVFAQIVLLPLRALTPLPDFAFLAQWLQRMQNEDLLIGGAEDLQKYTHLSAQAAEISLRGLCELGLLAYDQDRYRVQYKNQPYDLRNSPFYQSALENWEQQAQLAANWQSLSFERLKSCLIAQKGPS